MANYQSPQIKLLSRTTQLGHTLCIGQFVLVAIKLAPRLIFCFFALQLAGRELLPQTPAANFENQTDSAPSRAIPSLAPS